MSRPRTHRDCTTCGKRKLLTSFNPYYKGLYGRRPSCKVCTNRYAREHVKKHPAFRERRLLNGRKCHLKRKYGISLEDYQAMWDAQGGLCANCHQPETRVSNYGTKDSPVSWLAVDHCHKTGKIRALLCFRCNTLIGKVNEDIELLKQTIHFLEQYGRG